MRDGHGTAAGVLVWPPDDTEESVLGTNLHQEAIRNLCFGLNELAASLAPAGGALPFHAYGQTTIIGWQRPDGSAYTTLPDVYVYRRAMDPRRSSLSLRQDGPPVLIIEALSPSTADVDLDEARGKPYSYRRGGVAEYLVLDPLGEELPERGRGWRLVAGRYQPWPADEQGRWRSEHLPVAFGLEGTAVAVYGPGGRRQWREGEFARELARREGELARKEAEIAALRRQLEQRGR